MRADDAFALAHRRGTRPGTAGAAATEVTRLGDRARGAAV